MWSAAPENYKSTKYVRFQFNKIALWYFCLQYGLSPKTPVKLSNQIGMHFVV